MKHNVFKRLATVVTATAIVALGFAPLIASATSTWGPDRPSYTYNGPGTAGADHVVFNSFTNNPNYGDERTFFDGKVATDTSAGGFQDTITVTPNGEYLLRVYVHNNADPSLNGDSLNGSGVARDTTVRVALPTTNGRSAIANAFISASNASPTTVFDSVSFNTAGASNFGLNYIPGSATIYTNATPNGRSVSDNIVTTGAPIGYAQNDGIVPGCFQFTAIVTLKVKATSPTLTLTKQVKLHDSDSWAASVNAAPGDSVSWLVTFNDTGSLQADDVTLRDQLPPHVTLVPGSVLWFDTRHPNGEQVSDTALFTSGGLDLGSYAAGGGGYIRYRTTVNNDFTNCTTTLNNNAFVKATNIPEISAAAGLTVTKACVPPVTPPTTPLPQTGAEETALAGALGTTGLGYSLRAYLRSKRSLLDSLRQK